MAYLSCAIVLFVFCLAFCILALHAQLLACLVFRVGFVYSLVTFCCQITHFLTFWFFAGFSRYHLLVSIDSLLSKFASFCAPALRHSFLWVRLFVLLCCCFLCVFFVSILISCVCFFAFWGTGLHTVNQPFWKCNRLNSRLAVI